MSYEQLNDSVSDSIGDSDSDYEIEDIRNEEPPPDIDENFRNNVLNIKDILYNKIILSPNLGTSDAQDNRLLDKYLKNINGVYILCVNAQNGKINEAELNRFPLEAREPIKNMLTWLLQFFKKNQIPDTIPYEDYIRKSFKEYQFVQNNSFE